MFRGVCPVAEELDALPCKSDPCAIYPSCVRTQYVLELPAETARHTLVTDAPQFTRAIRIRSYSKRKTDSLIYMEIHEFELVDRAT